VPQGVLTDQWPGKPTFTIAYKCFWLGELSNDPTAHEISEVSYTFKWEMPSLLDKHKGGEQD
jgi:hypothetical protein